MAKMIEYPSSRDIVRIDGSYGEGGGQILRTALALSMITGQPVEFFNLRVRRPNPGLQPQHLTAIHAAATISNARVEGAMIGSTELRFEPNEVVGGEFLFDIEDISGQGSAGAVMLVAQTVLLPLAIKGQSAKITILGGTHVGWSPGTDYIEYVYLPALRHFGVEARVETLEGGFYPRGGGRAVVYVEPAQLPLKPIDWRERGKLKAVRLIFTLSNLPENILRRGDQAAETLIGTDWLAPRVRASGAALARVWAVRHAHSRSGTGLRGLHSLRQARRRHRAGRRRGVGRVHQMGKNPRSSGLLPG
jgi:RNA 3'-terminal phosphate cyclase (ATP)